MQAAGFPSGTVKRLSLHGLAAVLLLACAEEEGIGTERLPPPPQPSLGTDWMGTDGPLPPDPFDDNCQASQVHDPVAGFCVPPRGEGLLPQEGQFRTRHAWLQEAQASGEAIRLVVPGFASGGTGQPEAPLGDWTGATAGLEPGANVTFLIGRGLVSGPLELAGLGRVTLIGNAASVTSLVAEDEPVLIAEDLHALRIWGLGIRRGGEEAGPAVHVQDSGSLHVDQVLLDDSGGDGLLVENSGTDGVTLAHSTLENISGDGLRSVGALGWWTIDGANLRGPIAGDGLAIVDFGGTQFRVTNTGFGGAPIAGAGISIVDFGGTQFRVTGSEFVGDIGGDGISIVDFGGTQFRVADSVFAGLIGGAGLSIVDFGGTQFRVTDSQFDGPIAGDGISIVDFGGTQFRGVGNSFMDVGGSALASTGGEGTLELESNRMDGPIGRDAVTIVGFRGDGVLMRGLEIGEVGRMGLSASDSLGWWTLDGSNLRGPIGFDGLQLRGVGEVGKQVKITNLSVEGVSRRGMRLIDGRGWWVIDGSNLRNTGDVGMEVSGFGPSASMDVNRVSVIGAMGIGLMIDSSSMAMAMDGLEVDETRDLSQGFGDGEPNLGYGILVKDAGRLTLRDSKLRRNAGPALVIDLTGWGARRNRPDLSGEAAISLEDLEMEQAEDAPQGQPVMQAQNMPPETLVLVNGYVQRAPAGAEDMPMPEAEIAEAGCGDGELDEAVEQCDDGNDSQSDACTNDCKLNICGDGLVHTGFEECDDGNAVNHGDGCDNDCRAEQHVLIAGGSYRFGQLGDAPLADWPTTTVVADFRMSRHEVTCEDFGAYWDEAGSPVTLLEDGSPPAGGHAWHVVPSAIVDGGGAQPSGWPFPEFQADEPAEALGTEITTPAASPGLMEGAAQLPWDCMEAFHCNGAYPVYYLYRRFRFAHRLAGAYIDIHHPGAAIKVYLAGRLIHLSGWGDPDGMGPLLPDETNGMSRILLKPGDIDHLNNEFAQSKYLSIVFRPLNYPLHQHPPPELAFALQFKAWKQAFQAQRKPWINRRGEHSITRNGQLYCGDSSWPVPMDWHRARDYCRWHGGDLPTEAQWEYAARNQGQNTPYPWGDRPTITRSFAGGHVACDHAHSSSDVGEPNCPGAGHKIPVCSLPLGNTDQGLCDMIGNMWEWTLDGFIDAANDGLDNNQNGATDEPGELHPPSQAGEPLTVLPKFWDGGASFVARGSSTANPTQAYTLGRLGRPAGWFWSQASVDFGFRCAWPAD